MASGQIQSDHMSWRASHWNSRPFGQKRQPGSTSHSAGNAKHLLKISTLSEVDEDAAALAIAEGDGGEAVRTRGSPGPQWPSRHAA